jgi:hypothetical protein
LFLAELLDDAAQARPLFARLDLAGNADVIHRRHEDQEPPRHGDMRGQPRSLGPERLLDDLDEDLLALLQQIFDLGLRLVAIAVARPAVPAPRRRRLDTAIGDRRLRGLGGLGGLGAFRGRTSDLGPRPPVVVVFITGELLELLDGVDDFSDVEKRVALEADVDKRGLHAREDLGHASLVDVADDAARILAFDEDLDDLVVLEDRDARVVRPRSDDHLLVHCRNSCRGGGRSRTQRRAGTPINTEGRSV